MDLLQTGLSIESEKHRTLHAYACQLSHLVQVGWDILWDQFLLRNYHRLVFNTVLAHVKSQGCVVVCVMDLVLLTLHRWMMTRHHADHPLMLTVIVWFVQSAWVWTHAASHLAVLPTVLLDAHVGQIHVLILHVPAGSWHIHVVIASKIFLRAISTQHILLMEVPFLISFIDMDLFSIDVSCCLLRLCHCLQLGLLLSLSLCLSIIFGSFIYATQLCLSLQAFQIFEHFNVSWELFAVFIEVTVSREILTQEGDNVWLIIECVC